MSPFKLDIIGNEFEPIIKDMADNLLGQYNNDCGIVDFDFSNENGKGNITATSFFDWLTFLLFKIELRQDMDITIKSEKNLRCLFCQEGSFTYSDTKNNYDIVSLSGLISACKKGEPHHLTIKKDVYTVFSYVKFDKDKYFDSPYCLPENINPTLETALKDTTGKCSFFYQGTFGFQATEVLQELINHQYSGWLKRFFINAKSLELLTYQLKSYSDSSKLMKEESLSDYETEQIKKARRIIIGHLDQDLTILELSRKVGLNQQKLKTGFKTLFGRTIKSYTMDERMERAKMLLMDKDKKIGEIALMLGYSNRAHFARIFKRKFGVLPSDFVKSIEVLNLY